MAAEDLRKPWEQMDAKDVGHVGEVLEQGGGKVSPNTDDSGEPAGKPSGLEQL